LREDEFEIRIEADIAVDDVVAPVDDEERGNRVDAIVNINFPTEPFNAPVPGELLFRP
jgi:hypothetical protein